MTSRTPPLRNYTNFGKEPKENKPENSDMIDCNGKTSNKDGINQSPAGGNNTNTTTIENKPLNRGYRHFHSDNYGALFDVEYHYNPYVKKKEVSREEPPTDAENIVGEENNRENTTNDKGDSVVERGFIEDKDMAFEGRRVDQLELKNRNHAEKIHELENELRNIRIENDRIKGQFAGQDDPYAKPYANNGYTERDPQYDRNQDFQRVNRYPDPRQALPLGRPLSIDTPGNPGRPRYKNEQHRIAHRHGGADEEPYWGFNKYYDPQFITASRREHIPYYAKVDYKEKQTQYDDDYNYLHEIQRRQEEEWRRKRKEEEEMLMHTRDKPKTFEYTAPYQSLNPPRDINKYFHDSKYLDQMPEPKPDEYYFGAYAPFKKNPGTGVSTYERAYVSPRYGFVQEQQAGGLYIIRFADSGYEDVVVNLRQLQPIIKANLGYILGIARKQHVYPIEGDPSWWYSKEQVHRHQAIKMPCKNVEEAIACLWFPSKEKAKLFFDNNFHNRFRDAGFPTPHSYEGYYVPLLTPPILSQLNTYLVIELMNAGRYYPEDLQKFQAFCSEAISKHVRNSQPFVASALEGRAAFKPRSLFADKSKVYISRFESMVEVSEVWMKGIIQDHFHQNGISGPRNVWAFSLQDWSDF